MAKSKRLKKSNNGVSSAIKSSVQKKQYRKPNFVNRLKKESIIPVDHVKNPFEVRKNKIKHDVVGRAGRNEVGRPGVSRAKATEMRKGTLLEEYKRRNKNNLLIDRRIGEKNKNIAEEDKLFRRAAVEKSRQYKKKSIFSLGDDEILTHKGNALINIDRYEDPREQSDSEDELLNEAFVSDANFLGFLRIKPNDEPEDHANQESIKSRDEIIEELILASKKRKFDKAKESDENYEKIQNLDSEFKSLEFKSLLNQLQAPKSCKNTRSAEPDNSASFDKLLTQIRSGYNNVDESPSNDVSRHSVAKAEVRDSSHGTPQNTVTKEELGYDKLVRELQFESQKARPADLAKTTSQQADDDKESFLKLLSGCEALSNTFKSRIEKSVECVLLFKGGDKTKLPDILSGLVGFILENVDEGQAVFSSKNSRTDGKTKLSVLSPPFKAFSDIMLPHLYSLLVSNSVGCTKRFLEHLIQAREEFLKKKCRQISAQTIALLQLSTKLFPTDDFRHWVLNPVSNFLLFTINQRKFNTIQGAFQILQLACILLDIVKISKRFCPEVISFLWSVLLCFCPHTPYNVNLMAPNVRKARNCFVSSGDDYLLNASKNEGSRSDSGDYLTDDSDKSAEILVNGEYVRTVQQEYLSLTLNIIEKFILLYEYLPSSAEIFKPIQLTLVEMQAACELNTALHSKVKALVQLIFNLRGEKQFLRIAAAKPRPLKLYEPQIDEDFDGTRRKKLPRRLQEEARLSYKVKKELKSAVREIKKDNSFLAREQLREHLQMDADRKRKVKELLGSLANQEGDYQKMKKNK